MSVAFRFRPEFQHHTYHGRFGITIQAVTNDMMPIPGNTDSNIVMMRTNIGPLLRKPSIVTR